jgi:pSer/pThr/pTyr-binding forkhead associated (FHA) protein
MNYVLQVVRGRSASTTLKLADGVTSIGRHDDCLIRIKSSQVSRRHCEVFEAADKILVRDLGSSNGTFVNGKKIAGEQVLKNGDELTVGGVTLRVARLGQAAAKAPAGPATPPKAGDTAVVDAIAEQEPAEFEMEFDDNAAALDLDAIPLADEEDTKVVKAKPSPSIAAAGRNPAPAAPEHSPTTPKDGKEDDAIAQFLLDLKLDDEE